MPKEWTDEERKAFGDKMRASRAAKETEQIASVSPVVPPVVSPVEPTVEPQEVSDGPTMADMQRQINEVMETNALLRAAFLNGQTPQAGPVSNTSIGGGRLLGEVEKYLVDPTNYPDPTPRLKAENRLQSIAFNHNYELDYVVSVTNYETKTGINMKEPNFTIQLNRIVLDEQGEQTPKRYIARRYIFKEDPQAALILARENNLDIDKSDEKVFLNEMRYIRARDWLFGVFWPKSEIQATKIREEVIGGQLVQVFTKSSLDASSIDFDKLTKKMV